MLEAADNGLSDLFRERLHELYEERVHLDERVAAMEHKLHRLSAQDERCQRLLSIPGIGILSATALVAAPSGMSVPSSQGANGLPG
jgi:transposase